MDSTAHSKAMSVAAIEARPSGPLGPLRLRDFRLLILIQFATGLRQPIQFFAQAWYVNSVAPEGQRILLLGLLATIQGTAYLIYILFGGALTDRYPRKSMLLVAHWAGFVVLLATAGLLYVPGASEGEGPWLWIMMFVFVEFSVMVAQDFPARMALVSEVVPEKIQTTAVTLHWLAFSLAFLIAAPLVGWMLDNVGFAATYLVAAAGHLVVVVLLRLLEFEGEPADPDAADQSMVENVKIGVQYMRDEPGVRWVILVTWMSLAAGMIAMGLLIAAWVQDILGLSAAGWGVMALFWGVGGVLSSIVLAALGEFHGKGRVFIGAVAVFGFAVLGFSLSRFVPLSALFMLISGLAFQFLITLGNAIVQEVVPNRLMGRVMALLFMAQGIAQASGVAMGAIAQLVGLEVFYPGLAMFMLAVAALAAMQRPLRQLA